jgi:hypothetical protein
MQQLRWLTFTILLVCFGAIGWAQTPTGIVEGTVTDSTGALISSALVTITKIDTNQSRSATTDGSGRYNIPFVVPGIYTVKAVVAGFRPASQENVVVEVAKTHAVDFSLNIGAVTEQVEVTNSALAALDVDTSSLSQTIETKLINDLPNNGRNPFDFALLAPGVNNTGNASTPHIGGSRNGNNEQQIDGMTNILPENNVGNNSSAYTPIVDSVQEISVQTSVLPAEYGRFSGGTVSLVTKSGTNLFHGTLFEFAENSAFAAKPFGSGNSPKPDGHRYQTGGTIGGPISIPRVYNGHDKSFFFFAYENSRQANAVQQTYSVPQPQWLTGDFSALKTPIYDPLTVQAIPDPKNPGQTIYVRNQFAGNKIPASRLATPAGKIAQKVLSYFPAPSASAGTSLFNNFTQVGTTTNNYYHWDARVDQDVTHSWHSFLRFSHFVNDSVPLDDYKNAASPGGYNGPDHATAWSLSFNNTVTFSPTLVGEFRYGFSKSTSVRTAFNSGFQPTSLGFSQSFQDQASKNQLLFPHFGFSQGFSDLGTQGYVPLQENPLAHDVTASLVKILGGHSIKVGAEYRLLNLNFYQYAYPSGTFYVDNSWTQLNPQSNDGTGNPFASLLLGLPSSGDITNEPKVNSTSGYWAFYGQDDWKVTRKLTVNAGLRWDFEVPRVEDGNQLSYWDPTLASPLAGQITPAAGVICAACGNLKGQMVLAGTSASKYGRRQAPTQYGDFGPRLGFAYNPMTRLVIRSGVGIVYQPSALQAAGTSGAPGIEGFRAQTNFSPSFDNQRSAPVADLANPFPSGYQIPQAKDPACLSNAVCVQSIDIGNGISESYFDSYKNPYTIQWNASVQYALPANIKFEAGYLGNRGIHLIDGDPGRSYDQLPTSYLSQGSSLLDQVANPFYGKITTPGSSLSQPTISRNQLLRKFPQYGGVTSFRKPGADSIYHALTLRLDKQFSQGLTFTMSFTGGKAIDNSASAVGYLGPTSGTRADQYNPRGDRSVSPFDVSKQLTISTLYELPVGRGKYFLGSTNRLVNTLIGGWEAGGIVTYSTGTPVVLSSIDNGTTSSAIFTLGQRPTWNGKDANLANRTKAKWFDTSAFSKPAAYTIGNAPRALSNVRNPSYDNLDFSAIKNTRFGANERYNAQFRLELFNAFNHQILGGPDANINDGNFGVIGKGSYANGARQIQLAGKFYF